MKGQFVTLQVMLSQSELTPGSQWSAVRPALSSLPAFAALNSETDRQRLFQDFVADLKARQPTSLLLSITTLLRHCNTHDLQAFQLIVGQVPTRCA